MLRMLPALAALSLAAFTAPVAHAAAEIHLEHTSLDDNKVEAQTIYLSPDGVKMDMAKHGVIMRANGDLVMLNNESRTYVNMGDMAKQMASMQARMQAQLKNMPEAQRKVIEHATHMNDDEPPPTYTKTGSKTVNGWSCTEYRVKLGDDMQSDECFAKIGDLGLTAADLKSFQTVSQKMQSAMPPGMKRRTNALDVEAIEKAIGFEGVPVETTSYVDGKPNTRTVIKAVTHEALPASAFDVPAGYVQKNPFASRDMPGGND